MNRIAAILFSGFLLVSAGAAIAQSTSLPPLTSSPAVVVAPGAVAVPAASAEVTIPSQLRDAVLEAAATLITGMAGILLVWLRTHLKIMQDVGMNAAISGAVTRTGALLAKDLQAQGASIHSVNVHSPQVAAFANAVIGNYPSFSTALGLTPDKAAGMILGAASDLLHGGPPPLVPNPAPAPNMVAPQPVAEAVPQPPPPPA